MRRWLVLPALLSSCVDGSELEPMPEEAEGFAPFVERAQPVLEARCANPGCHGNGERPLSLFAVHRHRMDPASVYQDEPLSDEELAHNFLQASVFVDGAREPSESLLLTKPLAVRAGGTSHAGIDVFLDASDYDYRQLRSWIEVALDGDAAP